MELALLSIILTNLNRITLTYILYSSSYLIKSIYTIIIENYLSDYNIKSILNNCIISNIDKWNNIKYAVLILDDNLII